MAAKQLESSLLMTKDNLIQERLGQIRSAIESRQHMLDILLPQDKDVVRPYKDGNSLRNNDCDIEFTLVVKNGAKDQYVRDLSWLMDIQHIAFKFCRSPGHFRFLFSDGIFCELTVLEETEANSQDVSGLQNTPVKESGKNESQRTTSTEKPESDNVLELRDSDWLMGELLTNILIGLRRFTKGDKLSAFYLIQHHALSRLLELISRWETSQIKATSRASNAVDCFEQTYPQVATQVPHFALGYDQSPQSAFAMLKYIEQHENVNYFLKDQLINLIQPHSNLH